MRTHTQEDIGVSGQLRVRVCRCFVDYNDKFKLDEGARELVIK